MGREVLLGGNWADLIAVEPSGRLVIIEIKLAKNAEARRAVVAQILTYAAFLYRMDSDTLEGQVLASHLRTRGFTGLGAAVMAQDQEDTFDADTFATGLDKSLREGRFRLVLVLDDAPAELVRLVGYLEAVSDRLLVDLIVVTSYEAGGSQLVVPQRVDAERQAAPSATPATISSEIRSSVEGKEAFVAAIDQASPDQQPLFRSLITWATELETEQLAKLWTTPGKANRSFTLLPYIPGYPGGLVTIWNEYEKGGSLQFWRSVFERWAPQSLARLEMLSDAPRIGQGTTTRDVSPALLAELTEAYREASLGSVDLKRT